MATAQKKSESPKKATKPQEATALLRADHKMVSMLFEQYESARSRPKKKALATQICTELTVHAQIEEEIFYPAVRAAIDDEDLLDEAEIEHATAKDLIAQIEEMDASEDKYAARVIVLGEYIDHHVKEEQEEMFPKAMKAKLDMEALGEAIMARKEELKAELGTEEEEETEA